MCSSNIGGVEGGGDLAMTVGNRDEYNSSVEQVTERNRMQRARLDSILTLSLHRDFVSPSKTGTKKYNIPSTANLEQVETADLIVVLKIRGNFQRREPLPKVRKKVFGTAYGIILTGIVLIRFV